MLDKHVFDAFVEDRCSLFYAGNVGRPGVAPGVYFRMLMIGFFEGLDSERGSAWRVADSLSLRHFLGYELDQSTPEHSTLSRTRRLIDLQTHADVFEGVLKVLAQAKLLKGKTLGVDATTVDANAAMRSIVRRDTGEGYEEFLTRLAQASGIETPTREELAKIDKQRPKKGSNKDWEHPHDPDARITRTKDGRTHLAHKVEQAVDMDTQAIVAVTLPGADEGDTETLPWTLLRAGLTLDAVAQDRKARKYLHAKPLSEVVTDKGYHSNEVLVDLHSRGTRSYISEPDRGRRKWKGKADAQRAVYANRRLFLRHRDNILKRLLVHVSAWNLGLIMRQRFGKGTPRGMGRMFSHLMMLIGRFFALTRRFLKHVRRTLGALSLPKRSRSTTTVCPYPCITPGFATGC